MADLAYSRWVVVVPVRPAGKSRLGAGPELARAIALDTIAAATRATRVGRVRVVSSEAFTEAELGAWASLVREPEPAGIAAAVTRGLDGVAAGTRTAGLRRAVLLGDLPALTPADLDAALAAAEGFDRAFVPDEEGTGSALVTAAAGVALVHAFGEGSAERHEELGLVRLDVPAGSTLRRDVDTRAQLETAAALGLGPRTRALFGQG